MEQNNKCINKKYETNHRIAGNSTAKVESAAVLDLQYWRYFWIIVVSKRRRIFRICDLNYRVKCFVRNLTDDNDEKNVIVVAVDAVFVVAVVVFDGEYLVVVVVALDLCFCHSNPTIESSNLTVFVFIFCEFWKQFDFDRFFVLEFGNVQKNME